MQLQKRSATVLVCALLCCFAVSFTASAHSGRTDSQGGHHDRQNGGYHYHHGYSAHDHPGGACPYEADDDEEYDGGQIYAYEDDPKTEISKTTNRLQVEKDDDSDNSDFMYSMGIIALLLSPFLIGGVIIHLRLRKKSGSV